MGGSLGLLAAGRVADAFGIPAAWELCALILLAAAPCYWAIRHVNAPLAAVARGFIGGVERAGLRRACSSFACSRAPAKVQM